MSTSGYSDRISNAVKKAYMDTKTAIRTFIDFHSNAEADLRFLEKGLADHTGLVDSQYEDSVIRRIIFSYKSAKSAGTGIPIPYSPGKWWDMVIRKERRDYITALNDEDVTSLKGLMANFFRNGGIDGLWTYGYYNDIFEGTTLYKKWFVNSVLRDVAKWRTVVRPAEINRLQAPLIGNLWGYVIDDGIIMPISCRHNYYAFKARELTEGIITPIIMEIGGGFGGLAYNLLASGGSYKYLDFDLPEILAIAQYYLMMAFPHKKFLLYGECATGGIFREMIERYDVVLMPNFKLPDLYPDSADFVINTASLSEMEGHILCEYISQIARTCRKYFFHDNSDREIPMLPGLSEIPSSKYPIPADIFRLVYKRESLWGGSSGRYREHLYERI